MNGPDMLRALLGVMLALALVLALAFAFIWILRRLQDRQAGRDGSGPGGQQATLHFVRALPLGPRERAVLIDVQGERLLLGVAQERVSLLARYPLPSGSDENPKGSA